MDIRQQAERWTARATDPTISEQLRDLIAGQNAEALEDAFYQDLEFGTAGLRGVLGPGTNRMNIYTVGKATQGLADYLNSLPGAEKSVVIARDSRLCGELFCKEVAGVLAANGITAYLFPRIEPTPALSFATRYLHCDAGINVTASHNPSQYNGYKVYGPDGCQITSEYAAGIQSAIDETDIFDDVRRMGFDDAIACGKAAYLDEDVIDAFLDAVYAQSVEDPACTEGELKVVYTPLNGTGLECVTRILERIGVTDVTVVPEQKDPDGTFPTCPFPNPEIREALTKGIELCEKVHPDLLLATDPDADRVGVAVEDAGEYVLISGNEMGALLLDYVCRVRMATGTMPKRPVAVTTIVSTDLVDPIGAKYGVEVKRVLTGFKYIGELIGRLEAKGEADRFIFGFEESYGYLSGVHVRDKDAVNTSMLICQMARYYRAHGMNLVQAMRELYAEFGYFRNATLNFYREGADGARVIAGLMDGLRENPPADVAGLPVVHVEDYGPGLDGLPPANVLAFEFEGGQKMVIRPSGTEPKIKAYLFAHDERAVDADALVMRLSDGATKILDK